MSGSIVQHESSALNLSETLGVVRECKARIKAVKNNAGSRNRIKVEDYIAKNEGFKVLDDISKILQENTTLFPQEF